MRTPGPWVIGYGGQKGDDYAVITSPHSLRAICNIEPRDYIQANAHFIVKAANCHDDLVAALQAMITVMDRGPQPRKLDAALTWRENDELARSLAQKALALVKAQEASDA